MKKIAEYVGDGLFGYEYRVTLLHGKGGYVLEESGFGWRSLTASRRLTLRYRLTSSEADTIKAWLTTPLAAWPVEMRPWDLIPDRKPYWAR